MSITGIPGNIPYQGIKERNPPELFISRVRSPTTTDNGPQFNIGDIWVDTSLPAFYVLLSKEQGIADWALGGGAVSGILTINTILPDGGGDFTISGGTGITITPGVNSITIAASGSVSFYSFLPSSDLSQTGNGAIYTLGTVTALTVVQTGTSMATNGTFTAPVAGFYNFTCTIDVDNITAAMTNSIIRFVVNGVDRYQANGISAAAVRNATNNAIFSVTKVLQLSASDTVEAACVVFNGAGNTCAIRGNPIGANSRSEFGGFLIR